MTSLKGFSRPDFAAKLAYPDPTPAGMEIRITEDSRPHIHRFHFTSPGSGEVYFEIGRFPDVEPEAARGDFLSEVQSRIEGLVVGAPEQVQLAASPAERIEIRWPGKRRWVHFFNLDRDTWRVILDPDSPINLRILESVRFFE